MVTSMRGMFAASFMLQIPSTFDQDISSWNTGAVTDMSFMFQNNVAFDQPLSIWNTAAVTDFSRMFAGATSFNQDISDWTVSSAFNTSEMFNGRFEFLPRALLGSFKYSECNEHVLWLRWSPF